LLIPGLSAAQSWDFGIGKFPGSGYSELPGLESLFVDRTSPGLIHKYSLFAVEN